MSIKCTERMAGAGIEQLVGSVGESYNSALAESINGTGVERGGRSEPSILRC